MDTLATPPVTPPPDDFRCPISLELMSDPVILCTGQTYDRSSIQQWLKSGKRTCPNTTIPLQDTNLIPNYALRSMISQWAQAHNIGLNKPKPKPKTRTSTSNASTAPHQATTETSSSEITLKTLETLLKKKGCKFSWQELRNAVRDIKHMAKESRESRLRIVESGAVAGILQLLSCGDVETEQSAMVVLFYLSLDDDNKVGLVAEGAVDSIVAALRCGSSMECRSVAAVTLTSLAMLDVNKATIGTHSWAIPALVRLLADGDARARQEATTALYSLCFYNDNKRRAIAAGAVPLLMDGIIAGTNTSESTKRSLGMVSMLVTIPEGRAALQNLSNVTDTLTRILRQGSVKSKEHSISILALLCCNNKQSATEAKSFGVLENCKQLLQDGSPRTKRKAAALMKVLQECT